MGTMSEVPNYAVLQEKRGIIAKNFKNGKIKWQYGILTYVVTNLPTHISSAT
jgi:hypothetical protein